MNNLEQLVPPLELCKQIPQGAFADSALVWTQGIDGMFIDFRDARPEDEEGDLSAPTLAEILEALYSEADGRCERVVCTRDIPGWDVEFVYNVNEGGETSRTMKTPTPRPPRSSCGWR